MEIKETPQTNLENQAISPNDFGPNTAMQGVGISASSRVGGGGGWGWGGWGGGVRGGWWRVGGGGVGGVFLVPFFGPWKVCHIHMRGGGSYPCQFLFSCLPSYIQLVISKVAMFGGWMLAIPRLQEPKDARGPARVSTPQFDASGDQPAACVTQRRFASMKRRTRKMKMQQGPHEQTTFCQEDLEALLLCGQKTPREQQCCFYNAMLGRGLSMQYVTRAWAAHPLVLARKEAKAKKKEILRVKREESQRSRLLARQLQLKQRQKAKNCASRADGAEDIDQQ